MNQNSCSILLRRSCLNLLNSFHNSRTHFGNHYETLNLKRNCTPQEIRNSFIKLSKQNHPDVNKNPKAHKEFLKIQEAYSVLNKKESRSNYDLGLMNHYHTNENNTTNVRSTHQHRYGERRYSWDETHYYNNRARSQGAHYERSPYYGVRGINKVSNGTIAMFIIILAIFSFTGQMIAINYSFTMQRDNMLRKSQETQETLNEIRERANQNGNEVQMELLRRHFEERDLIKR